MTAMPPEVREFLSPAEAIAERPVPPLARAVLAACVGGLGLAMLWAGLATTEEIVYATGRVRTVQRTVVVQSLETSVIGAIHVREGQRVTKGQPLVTLDPTLSGSDLGQLEVRWLALDAQRQRVEAELSGKPFAHRRDVDLGQVALYSERQKTREARLRALDSTIAKTRAELETARKSAELLGKRVDTVNDMEKVMTTLYERELGSKVRMLSSRDQRLEVENSLAGTQNRIKELRHTLANAEAERDVFQQEWTQKLNEELVSVTRDLDQTTEAIDKAKFRKDRSVLVAPADGIVLEVAKRSEASVVREAEQLVVIVPSDVSMEVEARIDARDVGLVAEGTPARIKVDTFPYQKYGTLGGVVKVISSDSFARDASATPNPAKDDKAYYVAQIGLSAGELHAPGGKPVTLLPGMTVSAEIIIGRRSILSYLLRPLAETVDDAFHEP